MVIPYVGVFPGPPAHLAASSYFILVGTATILWAFATTFLFVNLLVLLARRKQVLRSHQLFPTWFLLVSSMVGLLAGLGAIVDTLLNSYDPPDIGNTTWSLLVTGLTVLILLVGFIGAIVASSEASWQGMETLE